MTASNLNVVVITGNLTADPELRSLSSGTAVCKLRVAVNTRRKTSGGEWEDKPNFFDVTVWGAQGENAQRFLSRGRPVAIQGRLEWHEWETSDGHKRQAVEIIADQVQFLGTRSDGETPEPDAAADEPAPAAKPAKRSRARKTQPTREDGAF